MLNDKYLSDQSTMNGSGSIYFIHLQLYYLDYSPNTFLLIILTYTTQPNL